MKWLNGWDKRGVSFLEAILHQQLDLDLKDRPLFQSSF